MKHDPYFKFIAAALIAGVLLAFFDSSPAAKATNPIVASTAIRTSAKS